MSRNRRFRRYVRWGVGLALFLLTGAASTASAVQFQSFSSVDNVCPSCNSLTFDTVTQKDGDEIEANIVAENEDFFVLERFGEVRAIPKNQVKSTSWAKEGKPANFKTQDQIVLENGHVLTGEIVEENKKPGYVKLDSAVGDASFVAFKKEVRALYRNGSRQTVETSSDKSSSSGGGSSSSSGS